MKIQRPLFLAVLMTISLSVFAQPFSAQADSIKRADFKNKIAIDMSVPDFDTKTIDANVMGKRLAGILEYLMKNYHQGVYDRKLSHIVSEQNEALENVFFQLKKLKFINAIKKGDEMTILMRADLQKNAANVKQVGFVFHFKDGVSESIMQNEIFSYISHYVQAREELR